MSAITPGFLQMFSAGMSAISSGVSGIAQYKAGQAEKAADEYNADVILRKMAEDEAASRAEFSRLMGRQRSLYAKAGVDISSGSPLLVLADTAMKEETEAQRIRKAGTDQANLQRYYGRVAAYRGKVSGISTFLTGLGQSAGSLYQATKGA